MKPTRVCGGREKLILRVNPPTPLPSRAWMDVDIAVFFALIRSLFILFFCAYTQHVARSWSMLATDDRNKNASKNQVFVQLFDSWRHWNGRKGINEAEEEGDICFRQEETQCGGFHLSWTLTQTEPGRRGGRGTHWIKEQGMRSGWEDEGWLWSFFANILLSGIFTQTTNIKLLKSDAMIFFFFFFWIEVDSFALWTIPMHNIQSPNKCPLLLNLSRRHSSASATVRPARGRGRSGQRHDSI